MSKQKTYSEDTLTKAVTKDLQQSVKGCKVVKNSKGELIVLEPNGKPY